MFNVLFNFDHVQEERLRFWRFALAWILKIYLLVILITITCWYLRLVCWLHGNLTIISRLHRSLTIISRLHRHLRLILILLLIWVKHRLLRHLGHCIISTPFYVRHFLLFKLIFVKSIKLIHKIVNILLFF